MENNMTGYERYKQIRKPIPPSGTVIESRKKKEKKQRDKEFRKDCEKYR